MRLGSLPYKIPHTNLYSHFFGLGDFLQDPGILVQTILHNNRLLLLENKAYCQIAQKYYLIRYRYLSLLLLMECWNI
jgi:hypothetical protein